MSTEQTTAVASASENKKTTAEFDSRLQFNMFQTKWWISLLALFGEAAVPLFLVWILSTPYVNLINYLSSDLTSGAWKIGIGWFFLGWFLTTFLTLLGYKLHLHHHDQFTYNYGLLGIGLGLYLTGFWWTWTGSERYYRILVAIGFFIIFLLLGTICSVFCYKFWPNKHKSAS